jgi:hypothetical protein
VLTSLWQQYHEGELPTELLKKSGWVRVVEAGVSGFSILADYEITPAWSRPAIRPGRHSFAIEHPEQHHHRLSVQLRPNLADAGAPGQGERLAELGGRGSWQRRRPGGRR